VTHNLCLRKFSNLFRALAITLKTANKTEETVSFISLVLLQFLFLVFYLNATALKHEVSLNLDQRMLATFHSSIDILREMAHAELHSEILNY
jgi:hypothetical protein